MQEEGLHDVSKTNLLSVSLKSQLNVNGSEIRTPEMTFSGYVPGKCGSTVR